MNLGLEGRAALVTASSRGIGRSCALGLAREGTNVTICARGKKQLERAAEMIRAETSVDVLAVPTDLTQPEQIAALVDAHQDHHGRIDILVTNNGGPPPSTFNTTSQEMWQEGLELSLWSVIWLCSEVVPHMQAQGYGRIVNITSKSVKEPMDNLILSNVARTGVIGLAKSLANELAVHGIRVNNICPGATRTARMDQVSERIAADQGITAEEVMASWDAAVPLGRIGRPEEIANAVIFMASDASSFITGTSLLVDGGQVRSLF